MAPHLPPISAPPRLQFILRVSNEVAGAPLSTWCEANARVCRRQKRIVCEWRDRIPRRRKLNKERCNRQPMPPISAKRRPLRLWKNARHGLRNIVMRRRCAQKFRTDTDSVLRRHDKITGAAGIKTHERMLSSAAFFFEHPGLRNHNESKPLHGFY